MDRTINFVAAKRIFREGEEILLEAKWILSEQLGQIRDPKGSFPLKKGHKNTPRSQKPGVISLVRVPTGR